MAYTKAQVEEQRLAVARLGKGRMVRNVTRGDRSIGYDVPGLTEAQSLLRDMEANMIDEATGAVTRKSFGFFTTCSGL